jgi:2-hydroxychromene-2-carboxylate isomerase
MQRTIEYYFSMHSPWAYIGHVPFLEKLRGIQKPTRSTMKART